MAKINPITKKEIEKEIKSISTRAKSAWPIRQEKYGRSLKSRDKIQVSMGGNQTVIGQIKNAAPYAWAIKAGKNSKTTVAPGRRIAEELLFKPAKNSAKNPKIPHIPKIPQIHRIHRIPKNPKIQKSENPEIRRGRRQWAAPL